MQQEEFRNSLGHNIFVNKYALSPDQTWHDKAASIVMDVCGKGYHGQWFDTLMSRDDQQQLTKYIADFKFLPGGRYIYYAGRTAHFWNNCYLLRAEEDTREEWAALAQRVTSCLMTGGGIGIDYSELRPKGRVLSRTGGISSGPIPLMDIVNEIGRNVMQGGSRRSAIYASLNWRHEDVQSFLFKKDWHKLDICKGYTVWDAKQNNFDYPAPLDMTNISLNYDDAWLSNPMNHTFTMNCMQACQTGEPGFSFNFGSKQRETLRNACTEVTSEDDSDVCNLGSVNLSRIESIEEFKDVVRLASKFLVCGTLRADLPYTKVSKVREKNRRLGLGIMGVHEWLLQRGYRYEVTPELMEWLGVYERESEASAKELCCSLSISNPVAFRAVAPTGTIGLIAGTTTGIEPIYAVAYKRRYLKGNKWHYEYAVDSTAKAIIDSTGCDPDKIETSIDLAKDIERRIKFQYDVQKFVDMSISSTANLPSWGTEYNNPDTVLSFAKTLSRYAHGLRGFTCYPDGARGGQPITSVPYSEAMLHQNMVFEENDSCKGGVCGV